VILYLAYASYVIIHVVCLLCAGTYLAVIGLFLVSGSAAPNPMTSLPMRILDDLKLLVRSPRALSAAVVFVAVAITAVMVIPEQRVDAASASTERGDAQAQAAASAVSATQMQQFEEYLTQQPCVPVMAPSYGAAVVIVKFNDYQCPG